MTLRERLKSETQDLHASLDSSLPLLSKDFDPEGYHRLLKKFYAFYRPLEGKILSSPLLQSLDFDYAKRLKSPKLEKDLLDLGETVTSLQAIPDAQALPNFSSAPQLVALFYVIEGSTLGGQFISKHLKAKWGEETPLRFLSGYGEKNGESWKEFLDFLQTFEGQTSVHCEMISSARETFNSITEALK